jgi:hypothetical protein
MLVDALARIPAVPIYSRPSPCKKPQVDGICQRLLTGIGWMPVVPTVIVSKDPTREIRVTEHTIKVDHIVIFSARADPRIDGLAFDLLGGRKDRNWGSRQEKPSTGVRVHPKVLSPLAWARWMSCFWPE